MPKLTSQAAAAPPLAGIAYVLGFLIAVLAAAMLIPGFLAIVEGNKDIAAGFAFTALGAAFVGGGLMFAMQGTQRDAQMRESIALMVAAWCILPAIACIPFLVGGAVPTFADAYFESVSAFTMTAASLLPPDYAASQPIMLWRAMLAWLGGYGSVLLGAMILSVLGTTGQTAQRALLPIGMESDRQSRFTRFAGDLFVFFFVVSLVGTILLWLGGVPGVAALCLGLSAIATAGLFPEIVGNTGAFAKLVAIVLMMIGATTFLVHAEAIRGRYAAYVQNLELRLFFLLGGLAAFTFVLRPLFFDGWEDAARAIFPSLFNAVSILSTTGYWLGAGENVGTAIFLTAVALTLIGGSSLSTAGGLKIIRLGLLVEQSRGELRRLSHPRSVARVRYQGRALEPAVMLGVWAFFAAFIAVLALATLALTALGSELMTAFTLAAAALSNAGRLPDLLPSGVFGGYAALPDQAKWLLAAVMIAGRCEVLALVSLLSPTFWRR